MRTRKQPCGEAGDRDGYLASGIARCWLCLKSMARAELPGSAWSRPRRFAARREAAGLWPGLEQAEPGSIIASVDFKGRKGLGAQPVDTWLRDQVAPASDRLKADPCRALTADQVRATLAAEYKERSVSVESPADDL
jgi:hypothetical protein